MIGHQIACLDLHPSQGDVLQDVKAGLGQQPKTLPCKLFYDAAGSALFDQICELEEYYPTRTEMAIMRRHATDMGAAIGPEAMILEYGSGSSLKTHLLLDALEDPVAYVPIDISRDHLLASAERLQQDYPHLQVLPVCADYLQELQLPAPEKEPRRRVAWFPGSTIGNFHRPDALAFLTRLRQLVGKGGGLLIGVDLKKDPTVLHRAYNDAEGITAAFNKNILRHINRRVGSTFDPERFQHYALYNPVEGRIEMHLVSLQHQEVRVNGSSVVLQNGESIRTECSYKYSIPEFQRLAAQAGFVPLRVWTDDERLFSVHYLEGAG